LTFLNIHHSTGAHSLGLQARSLARCTAKKWVVWNEIPCPHFGKDVQYTLAITPAGYERLNDLRLLLPAVIPTVRLLSR
jgi:hypothetical protein